MGEVEGGLLKGGIWKYVNFLHQKVQRSQKLMILPKNQYFQNEPEMLPILTAKALSKVKVSKVSKVNNWPNNNLIFEIGDVQTFSTWFQPIGSFRVCWMWPKKAPKRPRIP